MTRIKKSENKIILLFDYLKQYKWQIILVILHIIKPNSLEKLYQNFSFESDYFSTTWFQFSFLFTVLIFIILFSFKIYSIMFSNEFVVWVISLALVYLIIRFNFDINFYRINVIKFVFINFFDVLFLIVLIFPITRVIKIIKKNKNLQGVQITSRFTPYFQDIPLQETTISTGRKDFIEVIVNKLKLTNTSNYPFVLGIVGKWGSGKTTFINEIKSKIEIDKNNIIIDFKPWMYENSNLIIKGYFTEISSKISQYYFGINLTIKNYLSELIKVGNEFKLGTIIEENILNNNSKSIIETKKSINSILEKLNKNIYIIIDDLDRLKKEEIFEVLKLIRNAADFKKTIFIVGYDKEYIIGQLDILEINNPHLYLEKIFNYDFHLYDYKYCDLNDLVINKLNNILIFEHQSYLKDLNLMQYGMLENFRDVTRFLNVFSTNYDKLSIKNKLDIYFVDFIYLQLLRYKHSSIYRLIGYKTDDYFSYTNKTIGNNTNFCVYYLKDNLLFDKLEQECKELNLINSEIQSIKILLFAIFRNEQHKYYYEKDYNIFNNDFEKLNPNSMRITIMFNRYFDFKLSEDEISEFDFKEAIESSLITLKEKVVLWARTPKCLDDYFNKIENMGEIADVPTFKKILFSMFHVADLENNQFLNGGNRILNTIYYISQRQYNKFSTLKKSYNSENEYNISILNDNTVDEFIRLTFANIYIKNSGSLTQLEYKELVIYFEKTLNKLLNTPDMESEVLWRVFYYCANCKLLQLSIKHFDWSIYLIKFPSDIILIKIRKYIIKKDINFLLKYCVRRQIGELNNHFILSNADVNIFFGNTDLLFLELDKRKKDKTIQKVLEFYDLVKDKDGKAIEFNWEGHLGFYIENK